MDQFEIYPYRRQTGKPKTDKPNWHHFREQLAARLCRLGKEIAKWAAAGAAKGMAGGTDRLRRMKVPAAEQLKKALAWQNLPVLLVAFLAGRSLLLQELHPLAPAFVAAIYTVMPAYTAAAVLGTGLGLGTVTQGIVMWSGIANLIFVLVILKLVGLGNRNGRLALPVLMFASAIIVKTVAASLLSPVFYHYVVAFTEALFVGVLTYVVRTALEAVSDPQPFYDYPVDRKVCLGALVLGALIGLRDLNVADLSLLGIFSRLVLLLAVRNGGIGVAAIGGTVVGLAPGLAGGENFPINIGVYAFSGLLAGVFTRFGRLGAPLGLLLSNIFWSMWMPGSDTLLIATGESLAAIILYLIMPGISILAPGEASAAGGTVSGTASFGLNGGNTGRRDRESRSASRRLSRFAKVFEELAETFDQLASEGRIAQLREENVVAKIAEQVCQNCSRVSVCWEQNGQDTGRAFWNLISLVELEGGAVAAQPGYGVNNNCIRPRELLVAVKCMVSNKQNNQYWQKRLQESQELVSGQLRGVSQLMENLSREGDALEGLAADVDDPELPLGVEIGLARVAKDGSMVSGDSHSSFYLKKGKYVIALSDGMGAGPEAAEDSKATVSLLGRLLETGFQEDLAVKTINSTLMLRAQEERFATLDLAMIDLRSGEAEFIKIGASASFIKRGDNIGIINSTSLPIGILQQVDADIVHQEVEPGDIIVMMTDGLLESVADRVDKEQWVVDALARCRTDDPQNLADYLLNSGRQNAGNTVPDDMSVMVVRINDNRGQVLC